MAFQDLQSINPHKVRFTIKGVDLAYVNSVRRIILAEIPSVAFFFDPFNQQRSDINIKVNTGVLHNEFLGHRISLVPLCFDENEIHNYDPTKYKFILTKKNTTSSVINVTSKDFRIFDENDKDLGEQLREKLFPKNDITKDYILITKLKPNLYDVGNGEEIDVECRASVDVAKTHARFSCVSQCSYFNAIDEALAAKTLAEKIEECKKTQKNIDQAKARFETLEKYRCFKRNEFDEPNEFEFTIESECRLWPTYLFYKGWVVLQEKLNAFAKNLTDEDNDAVVVKKVGTIDNFFQIEIKKEDHTLVNVVQSEIYNKQIRSKGLDTVLEYIGYTQPHPLDQLIYIKLKFRAEKIMEVDDVKKFVQECTKDIVKDVIRLKSEWVSFSKLDKTDIGEINLE